MPVKTAHLIFPHQLFKNISAIDKEAEIFIIEEYLFFTHYKFHKQKLVFHRATMKAYELYLNENGFKCTYVEATDRLGDIRKLIADLNKNKFELIIYADVTDNWLEKRIFKTASKHQLKIEKRPSQLFVNTTEELNNYFKNKKRYFQTDFYIHQRKSRNILIVDGNKPMKDKWSFDDENRLKYPKNKIAPVHIQFNKTEIYYEAIDYVNRHYKDNYGNICETFIYPTTFKEAEIWLNDFFENRFLEFGLYEDAIVDNELLLHHSMLTPLLNIGLLLPIEVIDKAIEYGLKNKIPFNNIEGFIRQLLGWREYIRALYEIEGTKQRNKNYWNFTRQIPASFYDGSTGIKPIDVTIKKLLNSAYSHHIERLMILGNFMLLCEFHPNAVYQWFMEMYIDAYDWVMVPNVYGMSQFADGGLMCTKPYISSSNYILKMSNYKKEPYWTEIWDALFWRFMHVHREFFTKNPRLEMLLRTYDKWDIEKRNKLIQTAEGFLDTLDING